MSPRALIALFSVLSVLVVILGLTVSILSKRVPTDTQLNAIGGWQYVALRDASSHKDTVPKFNNSNSAPPDTCTAWYSSAPVRVTYSLAAHTGNTQTYSFVSSGRGDDRYMGYGWASYSYTFERTHTGVTEIVYSLTAPRNRCGYLGTTENLMFWNSPIDVITDLVGLNRIERYFD